MSSAGFQEGLYAYGTKNTRRRTARAYNSRQ